MLNSVNSFRPLISSKRLSGCALVALTVFSSKTFTTAFVVSSLPSPSTSTSTCSHAAATATTQQFSHFSSMSMTEAPPLTIAQFGCLSDNYGYLLHDEATGQTAAIDTPCGKTYQDELSRRGWKLTHIFNTHHHHDHTGGNLELKDEGVTVIGPRNEKEKIPGIDVALGEGDTFDFAGSQVRVMDAGGHTKGHISFYFPEQANLFVGDCLFSLGCGRMFEGTPTQYWSSLERLRALPDETLVYCAHEYTTANAKFAMSVEPNNQDLADRVAIVKYKRSRQEPTVPTLLGEEKKANPFLRIDVSDEIRRNVGVNDSDSVAEAFGKLRKAKDNFR